MKVKVAAEDCPFQPKGEGCLSRIQQPESRQAFAVLCLAPGGGSVSSGIVKVVCEDIHGVAALRVDAARGRIHVLYDGTAATIQQVEHALHMLGLCIRQPEEKLSSVVSST